MRTWVLAAVAAAAVAGCNTNPEPPPKRYTAADATVTDATFAALDAAIKAKKGEVVLVDLWATWCGPCRDSFPHFVELSERYADQGLACVSVSIDNPEKAPAVERFLKDQRAGFANFHWKNWRAEGAHLEKDFAYGGAIPHKVAFSRAGSRVWDSDTQPLSDRGLDELVRRLLAEPR